MNDLPTPKYRLGQKVWLATTEFTQGQHDCPDCLGSKVWAVETPAGLKTTASCLRCSGGYFRSDSKIPSLTYQKYVPDTPVLTIGSIEAKTHPYSGNDHVTYMAHETGVGSGRTYREVDLFDNEYDARAAAEVLARERQEEVNEHPESLKSLHMSGLTCDMAAHALSWYSIYDAWETANDYREIVDRIAENDGKATQEDIEDLLECRKEKPWRKKHPLAAMIEAVKAKDIEAAFAEIEKLPKAGEK